MGRVAVIGAGVMGLAAAHRAARDGHDVVVFEAAPAPGGMAAHFDFGGLSVERFYHFVSRLDEPIFALMRELEIADRLRWRPTSMGYFLGEALHPWGDPLSLLRFSEIDPLSKIRYGAMILVSTRRKAWRALEGLSAREWIMRWCGRRTYELLWRPLFELKFHEHADSVSAAWIWARIRRLSRSRRSLMQEELGYVEGGSGVLVDALVDALAKSGGMLRLNAAVAKVTAEGGEVRGVRLADGTRHPADHVISTVPTPLVSAMVPTLPLDWKRRYDAILNIGVVGAVFKLRRSVSPHLWVNIVARELGLPGLVEYTNLRPLGDVTLVYAPFYMPTTHERWNWPDEAFVEQAFHAIRRVNPRLTKADLLDARVSRLRYAQPICPPGFAVAVPPVQAPIRGLQIADTCFYYPEDRGIAESIRLGQEMAEAVSGGAPAMGLPPAFR